MALGLQSPYNTTAASSPSTAEGLTKHTTGVHVIQCVCVWIIRIRTYTYIHTYIHTCVPGGMKINMNRYVQNIYIQYIYITIYVYVQVTCVCVRRREERETERGDM